MKKSTRAKIFIGVALITIAIYSWAYFNFSDNSSLTCEKINSFFSWEGGFITCLSEHLYIVYPTSMIGVAILFSTFSIVGTIVIILGLLLFLFSNFLFLLLGEVIIWTPFIGVLYGTVEGVIKLIKKLKK